MDYDEIDELKGRRICIACIGEPHLVAIAAKLNELETCDYCEAEDAATMAIEELATEIEGAFDRHYVQSNTEPEGIEYALSKEGLWSCPAPDRDTMN